jgi:hypothetical protein
MTRHYQAEKHGPCLRCGMTYENMLKRHRLRRCAGTNLGPDGKPYPDGPKILRAKGLGVEALFA